MGNRILILARKAEPHVHWVNWVCSFLGTRTSEVADANTLDIECVDGIWVMGIDRKHRSRDQRLKTKVSTRKLALHGALLDEGFLDYWRSLPPGGPLFPNVPLDTYGKRASRVTAECSIWLRNVVKITDPNKRFCWSVIASDSSGCAPCSLACDGGHAYQIVLLFERPVVGTGRANNVFDPPAWTRRQQIHAHGHHVTLAIFPKHRPELSS
jgi:hypothetical protein